MTPTATAPPPDAFDVEAGVIEDARRRQRRHRGAAAAATVAVMAAALVALIGPGAAGPGARGVTGPQAGQLIHAGPLTVTVPAGWQWRIERGGYSDCTNPVIAVALASWRRPALSVRQGGSPIVVPANAVQLSIESLPIRSLATPWKHWRLSNLALRPRHPVDRADPNRFRAETVLQRSAAISAVAWLGSIPTPSNVLAAANGVLRSVRVDQSYACR